MGVFIDTRFAGSGFMPRRRGAAFAERARPVLASAPGAGGTGVRGPMLEPGIFIRLEEAARTAGKLEWSRCYAEIVGGEADRRPA